MISGHAEDPLDEFVMDRLGEFDGQAIIAAEKAELAVEAKPDGALGEAAAKELSVWLKATLGEGIHEVRTSHRLVDSPAVVVESDHSMTGSMRKVLKQMGRGGAAALEMAPDLELNAQHPVVVKLNQLRTTDVPLAELVAHQLFDQARLAAGRLEDPQAMLQRLNQLLARVVGV